MTGKLLLAVSLILLLGSVLLGGCGSEELGSAPAASASKSPQRSPGKADPADNEKPPEKPLDQSPKEPPDEPVGQSAPAYGLPLEIVIEDLPEVPEEIIGPSPPIEEEN